MARRRRLSSSLFIFFSDPPLFFGSLSLLFLLLLSCSFASGYTVNLGGHHLSPQAMRSIRERMLVVASYWLSTGAVSFPCNTRRSSLSNTSGCCHGLYKIDLRLAALNNGAILSSMNVATDPCLFDTIHLPLLTALRLYLRHSTTFPSIALSPAFALVHSLQPSDRALSMVDLEMGSLNFLRTEFTIHSLVSPDPTALSPPPRILPICVICAVLRFLHDLTKAANPPQPPLSSSEALYVRSRPSPEDHHDRHSYTLSRPNYATTTCFTVAAASSIGIPVKTSPSLPDKDAASGLLLSAFHHINMHSTLQHSLFLGTKAHNLIPSQTWFKHYSRDHTSKFRCSRPFSSDVAYGSGASQFLPVNTPWCILCPRVRGSRRWRQSSSVQFRSPPTVLHACPPPHSFGRINVDCYFDYLMLHRANAFGLWVKLLHCFFTLLSKSRPLMLLSFNIVYCSPLFALPLSLPPVVSIAAA